MNNLETQENTTLDENTEISEHSVIKNSKISESTVLLFSTREKDLSVSENEDFYQFGQLKEILENIGFSVNIVNDFADNILSDCKIVVISYLSEDLNKEQNADLLQFVRQGGGLLLLTNYEDLPEYMECLDKLIEDIGFDNREYFNYKIGRINNFSPHYITANVGHVSVNNLSVVSPKNKNKALPLAYTQWTKLPMISYNEVEQGRVVVIGDMLIFCDRLIDSDSNITLAKNVIQWLAKRNPIDIKDIEINQEIQYGQKGTLIINLQNIHEDRRIEAECVLESDADALIDEPVRKIRSIPSGTRTRMQWQVKPQIFGNQSLRLVIHAEDESLYFDQLPEMHCLVPGYMTMEIRDDSGKPKTKFETGSYFTVTGHFHWTSQANQIPFKMELKPGNGLAIRDYNEEKGVWKLKALNLGEYDISLKIAETGQEQTVRISVTRSTADQIKELYIKYVYPLDAEIAERLKQVDERLGDDEIKSQTFEILTPKEHVKKVYDNALWLKDVIDSANREIWYNPDLLDLVLIHICPTYKPNKGTFIPYAPDMASNLAELFSSERKRLEYNLLSLKESNEVNVKQNIATYLLHEKYGHGFFYCKTMVGRQLAILDKFGVFDKNNEQYEDYTEVAKLIDDSCVITSEGFGAWMELAFLSELDRDVRHAAHPRYLFLIRGAKGLYRANSEFFRNFPSKYRSRYREGFEHFDIIERKYNKRCAVRAFFLANQIDFGISETIEGELRFEISPSEIENGLLEKENSRWHSHVRLSKITDILYDYSDKIESHVRKQFGYLDEHQHYCPVEKLIREKLNWRL